MGRRVGTRGEEERVEEGMMGEGGGRRGKMEGEG